MNIPSKPAWWPENPYTAHALGTSPNDAKSRDMHDGWAMASEAIFAAYSAQADALGDAALKRIQQALRERGYQEEEISMSNCHICNSTDLYTSVTNEGVCSVCKIKYIGGLPSSQERINAARQRLGLQEGEFLTQNHAEEAAKILRKP